MTFIEEAVISGFISKVINNCVDSSPLNIKKSDKNRKAKSQTIQTRIYQVIIDAINELTNNRYKEQDKLYDSAEIIINGFKNENVNRIESVRVGLKVFDWYVDSGICETFIEKLYYEISKEKNFDLYKEILLVLSSYTLEYGRGYFFQIKQLLEQISKKLDENESNNDRILESQENSVQQKKQNEVWENNKEKNQDKSKKKLNDLYQKKARGVNDKQEDIIEVHYLYGTRLYNMHEYEEAEKILGECFEKRKETLGEKNKTTLRTQLWYGAALREAKKK